MSSMGHQMQEENISRSHESNKYSFLFECDFYTRYKTKQTSLTEKSRYHQLYHNMNEFWNTILSNKKGRQLLIKIENHNTRQKNKCQYMSIVKQINQPHPLHQKSIKTNMKKMFRYIDSIITKFNIDFLAKIFRIIIIIYKKSAPSDLVAFTAASTVWTILATKGSTTDSDFESNIVVNKLKSMQIESRHVSFSSSYDFRRDDLKELHLSGLPHNSHIPHSFLHSNPNLKSLWLKDCRYLKDLMPQEIIGSVVLKLKILNLIDLTYLENVGFEQDATLEKIESLIIIKNCGSSYMKTIYLLCYQQ
ncbi:hypothetical protein Ahy_B02g058163 isoform B [Arachis hypogaea]|uniref:Uncharacterized protein n=1 Tax=Arachis hypogaea TaxID=3818 RepID=A0A445ADZ9_ARAHY|nr:hypothetical protein Ahy_B02g058163 isoform B [Arachis hypogaea]